MDDYVHLLPTITESKYTVKQVKECLQRWGFGLNKFYQNVLKYWNKFYAKSQRESKDFTRVWGHKWNFVDNFLIKPLEDFPKNAAMYTQRKRLSCSVDFRHRKYCVTSDKTLQGCNATNLASGFKMGHIDTSEIIKTTAKKLNSYFRSPQLNTRESSIFLQVHKKLNINWTSFLMRLLGLCQQ